MLVPLLTSLDSDDQKKERKKENRNRNFPSNQSTTFHSELVNRQIRSK